MDKLKADFEIKAKELCLPKSNYNVLEKKIEVLELDETPAYGLETKVKLVANGAKIKTPEHDKILKDDYGLNSKQRANVFKIKISIPIV